MARAKLAKILVGDDSPVVVIGTLNLSPESFYGGSIVRGPFKAVAIARRMVREGAKIVDVGAMSTEPGSKPISAGLERRRLVPIVRGMSREINAPISVDTQRASVAKLALESGAEIINDVSGFKADPEMARVVRDFGCSAILMASKKKGIRVAPKKKPGDVAHQPLGSLNIERTIPEIARSLKESLQRCDRNGIDLDRVVIDPGIGFGKNAEHDLHILANIQALKKLERPICLAVSRKSFIGRVLGLPDPADRLWGSLAATVIAILNGASVIRTHDPRETLHAIRMVEAIEGAK